MNNIKQLEENVEIAKNAIPNMLSEKEIETLQGVKNIFNASYKVHCTGCHYCTPCPHGVNIPA